MVPPPGIEIIDSPLSIMWFEKDGMFCSVFKKEAQLTRELLEESFRLIDQLSGGKKICWLGEVTHVAKVDKETRDFAAKESPKIINALAIITRSQVSKITANLYLGLKKPPFPARLFTDENKAREWLRKYLAG